MTAEPRDIRERVALAMGWRPYRDGWEILVDPDTGLWERMSAAPPITAEVAMGMLREMRANLVPDGARWRCRAWVAPMRVVQSWGWEPIPAIAECWLAVRAAQEVRE